MHDPTPAAQPEQHEFAVRAGDGVADGGARTDSVAALAYRVACLALLALGLWVSREALSLTFYTAMGPGPGFFPLGLGLLLSGFSLALFVRTFLVGPPSFPERFLPRPGPRGQILVTVGSIAGFAVLVERLGFAITMFIMLMVLLFAFRARMFPTAVLVALAGSLGVGYAFTQWLGVYLPPAPGGVLRFIGL